MPRRKAVTDTENEISISYCSSSYDVQQQEQTPPILQVSETYPSVSIIDTHGQHPHNPEEQNNPINKLHQNSTPHTKKDHIKVLTINQRKRSVHVAVEGCCHGELTRIYDRCREHDELMDDNSGKIDFLICCGDFQCTRTQEDIDSMAVPEKYKSFGDFPKYCGDGSSGTLLAPYLTIFIGGNHEASNVLFQQYYGGFVAPNIYYLGHSGVIEVCGVRIAGLSGIWKNGDDRKPYPVPPYGSTPMMNTRNNSSNRCVETDGMGRYRNNNNSSNEEAAKRSAYHIRTHEITKLHHYADLLEMKILQDNKKGGTKVNNGNHEVSSSVPLVDIFISHDWPVGITDYGDVEQLLRVKPFFREDIQKKRLGNPHTLALLKKLRPQYWFAAHLHCYFYAKVEHSNHSSSLCSSGHSFTEFVALDKCILQQSTPSPTRRYIAYYDISPRALPDTHVSEGNETNSIININMITIKIPNEWLHICASAKPLLDASFRSPTANYGGFGGKLENLTTLLKYHTNIMSRPNIELHYPDGSERILAELQQLLEASTSQTFSAVLFSEPFTPSSTIDQKRKRESPEEEQSCGPDTQQRQPQKQNEDDNNVGDKCNVDFVVDC